MTPVVGYVLVVVIATATMTALLDASWRYRSPHLTVLLWQAAVVSFGFATVGLLLCAGLASVPDPTLPALLTLLDPDSPTLTPAQGVALTAGLVLAGWIAFSVASLAWETRRRRTQVRDLLDMVGTHDAALDTVPGVDEISVLDHPGMTAYCVPGWRSRVVLSTGTIASLAAPELRSVLAHERAHVRERHDIALLPLVAACRTLGDSRLGCAIRDQVALLVEMCADQVACRECGPRALGNALRRFGDSAAHAPSGTLGATGSVLTRCDRLDHPPKPLPRWVIAGLLLWAAVLVTAPAVLLLVPS
ncbi:MAG TPA: M56 family metallopeptidase [Aldersonia sp.]